MDATFGGAGEGKYSLLEGGTTAVMVVAGLKVDSVMVGRVTAGSDTETVGMTIGVVMVTGGSETTTRVVVVKPPDTVVEVSGSGVTVTVVSGTVTTTVVVGVGSGKTGRVKVAVMPSVMTMEVNWAAARPAAERMAKERILTFCFVLFLGGKSVRAFG